MNVVGTPGGRRRTVAEIVAAADELSRAAEDFDLDQAREITGIEFEERSVRLRAAVVRSRVSRQEPRDE